jgi:fructose-1,6-bisphosphatase
LICIKIAVVENQTTAMEDYSKLDMPRLLELLTRHTEIYTRLLAGKSYTAEFEESKFIIKQLQDEINKRRSAGTSSVAPAIFI